MDELGALRKSVEKRLVNMGIDPCQENEKTLRQLEMIEQAVDDEAARIAEARKTAAHGMPIVRVVELSGISRQTFYNKPLLKEYSAKAIKDAGIEEGREEIARLKQLVTEHEATIASLVKRDWELLEERARLRDAQIEIAGLKASLAEAKSTIAKLSEMLEEASSYQNASQPGKIIDFRRLEEH